MIAQEALAELQLKAQRKHKRLAKLREDPRYRAVLGTFLHAKMLTTNSGIPPRQGPVALKSVLWAGKLEPRFLELLPAVMLKLSKLVEYTTLPADLDQVLVALKHHQTPPDFRGIPGDKIQRWFQILDEKESY